MEKGAKRAALVWPRRAGKDTLTLHWTCFDAHQHIGNYWHLFPESKQARKAIWNGIDKEGHRIIDRVFPHELRAGTNDQEMLIRLKCGSTWQLGGSDRFDSLVGSNPRGVVFSEFAISNPRAYEFVRPILAENHGWAMFPYTPRGRNHGFELFERLQGDTSGFAQLLTCDETGHMSLEALTQEQRDMSQELYLQEYFCSWDYGIEGSYYAKAMNRAVTDGRVTHVPYDESLPVWTAWDIGLKDSTAIWFYQAAPGGQVRFIDYYEAAGEQIRHYADVLRDKPYSYGDNHFLPHDAGHTRLGQPDSVAEQATALGISNMVLSQEANIAPAIESCRVMIGRAWFDEERTQEGRAALSAYRKEWDDQRNCFKPKPLHDWSSNGADAFRYATRAYDSGYCFNSWSSDIDYSLLDRAAI